MCMSFTAQEHISTKYNPISAVTTAQYSTDNSTRKNWEFFLQICNLILNYDMVEDARQPKTGHTTVRFYPFLSPIVYIFDILKSQWLPVVNVAASLLEACGFEHVWMNVNVLVCILTPTTESWFAHGVHHLLPSVSGDLLEPAANLNRISTLGCMMSLFCDRKNACIVIYM